MKNNFIDSLLPVKNVWNINFRYSSLSYLLFFITIIFPSKAISSLQTNWLKLDTLNSNLPDNRINSITQDNDGFIWVATHDGFAKYIGNNQWSVFHNPNALMADVCLSIKAQDSILWVATVNGLVRYCNGQIRVYDPSNSNLAAYYIYSLEVEGTDLWIGTGDFGVYKFNGITFINYTYSNTGDMPLGNIWSIAIDYLGQKWFSCADARPGSNTPGAIVKFDDVNWILYDTSNSGLQTYPVEISIDDTDHKWITSVGHGLVEYDNFVWKSYDSVQVSNNLTFRYGRVAFDIDNNKWITTTKGFSKYDNNSWTFFDSTNVPFPSEIQSSLNIFVDNANNKWVGTINKGILIYNENGVSVTDVEESPTFCSFNLYPNPSQGMINLVCKLSYHSSIQYSILNVNGETMCSFFEDMKESGDYKIAIPVKLQVGFYFLLLNTNRHSLIQKIIIYD